MNYDNLLVNNIDFLKGNKIWDRAVSVDIEADLKTLDFPEKHILNISTARRIGKEVEIRNFIADEQTQEDEVKVIESFAEFCEKVRPLVLIGYGISRFDFPILLLKMRQLDNLFKREGRYQSSYWAFRDTLTRTFVFDVINPVRFEIGKYDNTSPKFISLEKAICHKRFNHLPFKNTKNIVSGIEGDKWKIILNLWRNDRNSFKKYAEGDVHDTLLLAEDIFGIN